MEKTVHLVHRGGLHFEATTGSGHTLAVDDLSDDHGPRPMEYVLAALGACGGMDVAAILVKKRQRVIRHEISVVGQQREEHPRIFTTIALTHHLDGPQLDPEAVRRAIELSATKYCPVNAMLALGAVTIHHGYVARSDEGETAGEAIVVGPSGAGLAVAPPADATVPPADAAAPTEATVPPAKAVARPEA
jgi:putative redox protein